MRRHDRAVLAGQGKWIALAAGCALGVLLPSGQSIAPARPLPATTLPVRSVRVLIASDVHRIRIRADGTISIHDDSGAVLGNHSSGDWITIYARDGHVFLVIAGLRFDTQNSSRQDGPAWRPQPRSTRGHVRRHPPGL